MAHVHGAAAAAAKSGNIAAHGTQMAQSAMGTDMMSHVAPAAVSFHNVAKGAVAAGAAATTRTPAVKSFVHKLATNPWVLLGLGVAVGYTLHKYRKEIIASANRVAEKSKDFVLQQRENLEDLVAETGETES